jgi:Bacterial Ig domain
MRRVLPIVGSFALSFACAGSPPTTPTPLDTTPAANQPPKILSATVSPGMGVSQVTRFTARVEAVDPDGDPLTYAWLSGNRTIASEEREFTFVPGPGVSAIAPFKVTVTDSRGASVSASVDFVTAALDWEFDAWAGQPGHGFDFRLSLAQQGNTITGRITDFHGFHVGFTDPADPGRIDADGRFRIRFKLESLPDTIFTGELMPYQPGSAPFAFFTRFIGVGRISGGRFDGYPFTFGYHDSY